MFGNFFLGGEIKATLSSPSYLQELESVSGWLFSSVPAAPAEAAAGSTSFSTPAGAEASTTSWGNGASPGGSMFVTGRARRRGGGEIQESAAAELLHSGWLRERVQEFPVAPEAPAGPPRLPAGSANFLPLPLHRLDPALPLTTSPLWQPTLGLTPDEFKLLQPLIEGPSAALPPVLLALK